MARKRRAREVDEDEEEDAEEVLVRRCRRPRWRRRFLAFVILVGGLVAAGPTIIAKTPLRNVLLSSALPPGSAQLGVAGAEFSWISGQALVGVTLADAVGTPIATIERATVDRSLVALAANRRHLGKIVVTRPVINLETRVGGSNLEDLLDKIAAAVAQQNPQTPDDGPSTPTVAEIEILEGTVLGRDAVTGQVWRIDGLALSASQTPEGAWQSTGGGVLTLGAVPPTVAASLPTPGANEASPGRFKFQLNPADAAASVASQQLGIIADRLPLAPLEPWLARVLPGARLLGTSSADLKITWSSPAEGTGDTIAGFVPTYAAAGKLDAADVRFTADALAGDLVELPTAAIAIDATLAGTRLASRHFTARTTWLDAEATGEFDLAQLTTFSPTQLPMTDALLSARVDLPQLTRMLPRTLRLRPGVRIDSGKLELTARSAAVDAGRTWTVAAVVENLLGHDGTRAIRWTEPVEAGVDLADAPAGPQLKRLLLRSPFASLTAEGAAGGIEGQLAFDLEDLASQLGQFVDLSAWQLRGTGQGTFSWRDTGADKFAASASLDCTNIDVRKDGRVVWVDPQLRVEAQSNGLRVGARPVRFEAATALMRGPSDSLELELLEPVDLAAADRNWFLRVKGDGPLDSWAGRLRPWVAAVPDELSGQSTVNARVRLAGGLVEFTQSQVSINDFRTRLAGKELIELRIEAGGDFRWDSARRAIESQNLTIASSTIAATARGVDIRLADVGPPTVRGVVAFRGDLERIAAWAGMVGAPGGLWPRGQGVGRMELASDATRASANLTLNAEPFSLVRLSPPPSQGGARGGIPAASVSTASVPNPPSGLQPTIAWNEPALALATEIAYTHADDRLQLTNLRLDGQTVKLSGAGAIDQLRTAGVARGDVNVTYDSAELAKLLATYLGPGIRIQGANAARITMEGRLVSRDAQSAERSAAPPNESAAHWSRRYNLTAETGWAAANLYGLPIGQAAVTANIRDGQIQFHPIDLAVGQGRLTAQPRVLLDPPPQVLQLAAGPLVSNVAVSEEVSQAMLKYAAPILADATRTSGSFSIITEGVTVPLGDPKLIESKGRVTMHQLAILPGPGLADVVTLIQRLELLSKGRDNILGAISQPTKPVKGITMTERTIDVQVVGGRVYHRNLEFLIDDVPVTSYGSVGFDQSISLVLRVPVQEKWVRGTRELQPLIGKTIEIPVSGTMSRWNVDERAVGAFLAQAAQTAVGGAIESEINKALEGLFRKK